MKTVLYLFAFALTVFCSDAKSSPSKIKITHLQGPLYIVEDNYWMKENSVFFVGEKGITLISASWTPATAEAIASEIKRVSKKPIQYVVDTHFHVDRAGGNAYFRKIGAKIISTVMTKELMAANWERLIKASKKSWPGFPDVPLVLPDITFENKYVLENGQIELLYLGPSHTKDGIVAYFPKEQILDADCILKEKLGNLDSADLKEYPKTIAKMRKLAVKTIIAGHWSPIHGPELFDQYLALLGGSPKPR